MQIRKATADDVPFMVAMLRDIHAARGYSDRGACIDEDNRRFLEHSMGTEGSYTAVAEQGGDVIGMLICCASAAPFNSSSVVAYQQVCWVDPSHRRSGVGVGLLRHTEQWARSIGARSIVSVTDDKPAEVVLKSNGYKTRERCYWKAI